jgi:hypothetical protein
LTNTRCFINQMSDSNNSWSCFCKTPVLVHRWLVHNAEKMSLAYG